MCIVKLKVKKAFQEALDKKYKAENVDMRKFIVANIWILIWSIEKKL